jgi:hypothetical protein
MIFTCDFCNKTISEHATLYFGFDCLCCSNHCRSQVIQLTLQIDPRMNDPHTWLIHKLRAIKAKAEKAKAEPLIPKNRSLVDLVAQLNIKH